MKFVFGIILICLVACGAVRIQKSTTGAIQDNEEKILWLPDRKLTWNDFKGVSRGNRGGIMAETAGEIVTEKSYWLDGVPKFEIHCYFLKNKSWTITSDSLTLEHEQIHFDIYEVYTRKIRKAFDSLNSIGIIDFKIYENSFNSLLLQNEHCNERYDNEVRFDRVEQRKWIDSIGMELDRLKAYEYIPEN